MAIYSLARDFNHNGLRMSNSALAEFLHTDRRHIPRIIKQLKDGGFIRCEKENRQRVIRVSDTKMVSVGDTNSVSGDDAKVVHKRHQNGAEVTPHLPSIQSLQTKQAEERTRRQQAARSLFLTFWDKYPQEHRGSLDRAEKAWRDLMVKAPNEDLLAVQIDGGLSLWLASNDWAENGGQWIPTAEHFLSGEKWRTKPKNINAPKSEPCKFCKGESANYSHDSCGYRFWFCRECQPKLKGILPNDLPTGTTQ